MRYTVDLRVYSSTALLTAIKKQQVFADWSVEERSGDSVVLSMLSVKREGFTEKQCLALMERQLSDETIREKLEIDFKPVRDRLVALALSSIERS